MLRLLCVGGLGWCLLLESLFVKLLNLLIVLSLEFFVMTIVKDAVKDYPLCPRCKVFKIHAEIVSIFGVLFRVFHIGESVSRVMEERDLFVVLYYDCPDPLQSVLFVIESLLEFKRLNDIERRFVLIQLMYHVEFDREVKVLVHHVVDGSPHHLETRQAIQ